jgi:purine-binding chemotaxis protein CheW
MTAVEVDTETPEQMVVFSLDTERYCVGIDAVDEIVGVGELTALPNTPQAVAGVMELRGEMTTIVELESLFGGTTTTGTEQVIIVERAQQRLGWLVTAVDSVRETPEPDRTPVADNQFVNGLISKDEQFILWVNPDAVHSSIAL